MIRSSGSKPSAARVIGDAFARGGKLLLCGNGGSAADAQHFACEFVGRFKYADRAGLPALALTADSAVLTAPTRIPSPARERLALLLGDRFKA